MGEHVDRSRWKTRHPRLSPSGSPPARTLRRVRTEATPSSLEDLLARVETRRQRALEAVVGRRQASLGQYFTPTSAAQLLAAMPPLSNMPKRVRILDPGAGTGNLAAAMAVRLLRERPDTAIHVVAVELDEALTPYLRATLDALESVGVATDLVPGNYIELAVSNDPHVVGPFDLVIQNPPYGKLAKRSTDRSQLSRKLVDVPNIYAAFWALGVEALAPGGQCVALVPRSWANGPYFEAFRHWLLERVSIDALHVFESRSAIFTHGGVLQENVIVSVTRGDQCPVVTLSRSVDHTDQIRQDKVQSTRVIEPNDLHKFVRFPDGGLKLPSGANQTLADLGVTASAGRVVDFRSQQWLTETRSADTVPLIYPANIRRGAVVWPLVGPKSQHFLVSDEKAQRLLVPPGTYVLVKRFTSKEERRRIVAGVWTGGRTAFDNKTNYLHVGGAGMPIELARGLSTWLNSTTVDVAFRAFSGHTQVNAGDLHALPFPTLDTLVALGRAAGSSPLTQDALDALVAESLKPTEGPEVPATSAHEGLGSSPEATLG